MLDTIAKSAVAGSIFGLFKRVSSRKTSGDYLGAAGLVVAGLVIGAGAALLFAPKSGAELRADVRSRAKRLTSGAQEKIGQFRNAAKAAQSELETH